MPLTVRASVLAASILAATSARAGAQAPALPPSASASQAATELFDDSQLQEIRLVVNPRDWADLKASYQLNTYYPAHFLWRGHVARNVGIRSRGTGSRSGSKPGVLVDFNRFDPAQRFLGLKSVVLRNHTQDPSQLHERIAMRLFARLEMPAPREAQVRLYVNDEYAGLYSVVESVDKVFLSDRFGQDGGYLYEYDSDPGDAPYRFEYRGPLPSMYSPKPFKPVTHELDPDARPIADMVRAIVETPDTDFLRVLSGFLDLERFVSHVAVEAFVAEIDGVLGDWGMNNFYLYRFEGTTRSTLVPWDRSEAFKGGVGASIWRNVDDVPPGSRNALMVRLMREPALRAVYFDTLLRCADLASAGWLEQEITRAADQIRDAVRDDQAAPFSFDQFEEEVQRLLAFARERADIVREDVRRSPR
ncbi:MAG TPA: CotH kinase family protein [Vicinamibacterales bacterium]|nr:CotH kinase family protein [Vicinamibacterales bacterium]